MTQIINTRQPVCCPHWHWTVLLFSYSFFFLRVIFFSQECSFSQTCCAFFIPSHKDHVLSNTHTVQNIHLITLILLLLSTYSIFPSFSSPLPLHTTKYTQQHLPFWCHPHTYLHIVVWPAPWHCMSLKEWHGAPLELAPTSAVTMLASGLSPTATPEPEQSYQRTDPISKATHHFFLNNSFNNGSDEIVVNKVSLLNDRTKLNYKQFSLKTLKATVL